MAKGGLPADQSSCDSAKPRTWSSSTGLGYRGRIWQRDSDPWSQTGPSHQSLPFPAVGSNAWAVQVVSRQVGRFMAQDLVDDLLRLIEKPSGKSNAVLDRIGTADGAGHPVAKPQLDFGTEFAKLPHAQTVLEEISQTLGMFRWDIRLSEGTLNHRGSIAGLPQTPGGHGNPPLQALSPNTAFQTSPLPRPRNGTGSPLRWARYSADSGLRRPASLNGEGAPRSKNRARWGIFLPFCAFLCLLVAIS